MRLDRLDLVRFGHFSDFAIDFGSAKNNHDFHVIYGDNEAGKSTSYNALLDLLFGFPARTNYSFRHGSKALRIDATLSTTEKKLKVSRLKSGLYDHAESLLSESVFAEFTRGLTRDTYGTMFSMDEETLEQGGNDIVASKGDLATLLFSAAAGLGSISQRLDTITEKANYYRPNAQKMPLKNDLSTLSELGQQLEALDTRASEFRILESKRLELDESLKMVNLAIKSDQSKIAKLDKQKNAAGCAKRLLKYQSIRERYKDLPTVPRQWWTELQTFVRSTTDARNQRSRLENTLSAINEAINVLPPVDFVLDEQATIEQLQDMQNETLVLEKRITQSTVEFEHLNNEIEQLTKRLPVDSLPDTTTPLFRSGEQSQLQAELRHYVELSTLLKEAQTAEESAKNRKANLVKSLPEIPVDPAPLQHLLNAISAAEDSNYPNQLIDEAAQLEVTLNQHLHDLAPWQGSSEQLRELHCPEIIQIDNLDKAIEKAQSDLHSCLAHQQKIKRQQQTKKQEIALLEGQHSVADRKLLSEIQDSLWSQWYLHQQQIEDKLDHNSLSQSAHDIERLLKTQEHLWSQQDANVESMSQLKIAHNALSSTAAALEEANQDLEAAKNQVKALESQLAELNYTFNLPDKSNVQSLKSWLKRREDTLRIDAELRRISALISTRQQQRNNYSIRIWKKLNEFDSTVEADDSSLEELMQQANDVLSSLNSSTSYFQTAAQQINDQILTIESTSTRRESLVQDMQSWEANWKTLVRDNCLNGVANEDLQTRLALLMELDAAQKRIRTHTSDREQLASIREHQLLKLREVSTRLGLTTDDTINTSIVVSSINELAKRLEQAHKQVDQHEELSRQREDTNSRLAELLQESASLLEDFENRKRKLNVTSMEDLQLILNDCQKRDELDEEIDELTLELQHLTGIEDDKFLQYDELEFDSASIDLELENSRHSLEALLGKRDQYLTEMQTLVNKLDAIGSSNEVARLDEERSNLRLYIQEQTRSTMKSRLGVAAAREGMRQYREAHQSNMLTQAGNIFREITGENFTGLKTQPDKKQRELLFAVTNEGNLLEADKLSKGTRFQLFLALRLAAYKDYARSTVPLPFVADDILDAFDNQRSAESLEQFHEISQTGQVIYLTHHKHIVDLAKEVSNDTVRIHELPPRIQHIA